MTVLLIIMAIAAAIGTAFSFLNGNSKLGWGLVVSTLALVAMTRVSYIHSAMQSQAPPLPPHPPDLTETDLLPAIQLVSTQPNQAKKFVVTTHEDNSSVASFAGSDIPGATVERMIWKTSGVRPEVYLVNTDPVSPKNLADAVLEKEGKRYGVSNVIAWNTPETRRIKNFGANHLRAQCLGSKEQKIIIQYLRCWEGEVMEGDRPELELVWDQWIVDVSRDSVVIFTVPTDARYQYVWVVPVFGERSLQLIEALKPSSPYFSEVAGQVPLKLDDPLTFPCKDYRGKKMGFGSNALAGMPEDAKLLIGISAKKQ